MPVIPATREAEAGELLEPGRQRLRRAEIVPLHSDLVNKSDTLSQERKEKNKKTKPKQKPPTHSGNNCMTIVKRIMVQPVYEYNH